MDRRGLLRWVGLSLAGLAGCANAPGPTGPRRPPESPEGESRQPPKQDPLRITTFDFGESQDGDLRVFGTVENRGESEQTTTVEITATTDGEEYVRTTEITVPPGATRDFSVEFDLEYQKFAKDGSLDVSLSD